MSFENPHSPIENQVSDYEIQPEEDFDAHSQRIADIRYQEEIEQENIGDPDDILKALDESDKGVAQSPESHKGGGIENLPIEQQIAQVKLKIQTLEANFNSLTDQQLNELLELYERKSELENQQSSMIAQQIRENEATIDIKTETLHSAQEIQRFLNADIRSQFANIDALLNPADNLLATLQEGSLLTQAENHELAAITRDTLSYLKNNRSELTAISREMQTENPQEYESFKTFLISQDTEFWPIFAEIDAHAASSFEASIAAAFPIPPQRGNSKNGFAAELDDGSLISLNIDAGTLSRSLDLAGANFPIETTVHEVDVIHAQNRRDTLIAAATPKLRTAKLAIQLMNDPRYANFADMKKALQSQLSPDDYEGLSIADIHDPSQARDHLNRKIEDYEGDISKAEQAFHKTMQEAIAKVRENYERQDEELKLSLKAMKNSGLGRLGMDWIVRELMAGQLMPDIGAAFDTGNFNPSSNNFGEPPAESGNPTRNLEYIYRLANKAISGNPEEPFSLNPSILQTGNPQVIASSPWAVAVLLGEAGLMWAMGIVNKELVRERLRAPTES